MNARFVELRYRSQPIPPSTKASARLLYTRIFQKKGSMSSNLVARELPWVWKEFTRYVSNAANIPPATAPVVLHFAPSLPAKSPEVTSAKTHMLNKCGVSKAGNV